jgi:hypothetical protein
MRWRTGIVMFAVFTTAVCWSGAGCVRKPDPEELSRTAAAACAGVCTISGVSAAASGPPIVILEEQHTSRAGQIQLALALVRLYHDQHLRDIGLEGSVFGSSRFDVSWARPLRDRDRVAFEGIAVRLLQEGEIGAVELMGLLYDDLEVHPIEQPQDRASPPRNDPIASLLCTIGERSLDRRQRNRLQAMLKDLKRAGAADRPGKLLEVRNLLGSSDPWVESSFQRLDDILGLKARLALIDDIVRIADQQGFALSDGDAAEVSRYRSFFEIRNNASTTMAGAADAIAEHTGEKLIAINIGAAHTRDVVNHVEQAGRQSIVLTPLALRTKNSPRHISPDQLNRKYERQSIYVAGIAALLGAMKPEPVVGETWLKAKSDLYFAADQLATGGGYDPPVPGSMIHIVPASLQHRTEHELDVVVFQVEPDGNTDVRRRLWVKAARAKVKPVPIDERARVEQLLRDTLDTELNAEHQASTPRAEREGGKIQVTTRTVIAISPIYEEVLMMTLSTT